MEDCVCGAGSESNANRAVATQKHSVDYPGISDESKNNTYYSLFKLKRQLLKQ